MRKVQFTNKYFYHIYNRGTDKREIFSDEKDYFRFIHDLFEFNDNNAALNVKFRFIKAQQQAQQRIQQIQNYGGEASIVKASIIKKARE